MKERRADAGALNVLGEALAPCGLDPVTGFYRDGCCNTGYEDVGIHVVCAKMTREFLAFSKKRGNDLSTPMPEAGFPGLKPGDRWCLCAGRWKEALDAGVGHVALADRHLVVHRVEDALVLAHEILDVLGLQSLETLAHAGDGRAARVLVVDQRVVEIEEDRANHFTAVNG